MYICENPDGFVLLSSVYHIVPEYCISAKYLNIVYSPGNEYNSTIYCSDIN